MGVGDIGAKICQVEDVEGSKRCLEKDGFARRLLFIGCFIDGINMVCL